MASKKNALKELSTSPFPRDAFEDAIREMAAPRAKEPPPPSRERDVLAWFRGRDSRPDLVPALAMLLVIDALADARGRTRIADLMGFFPRSGISSLLAVLRAHNFVTSDAREIQIRKLPHDVGQHKEA